MLLHYVIVLAIWCQSRWWWWRNEKQRWLFNEWRSCLWRYVCLHFYFNGLYYKKNMMLSFTQLWLKIVPC